MIRLILALLLLFPAIFSPLQGQSGKTHPVITNYFNDARSGISTAISYEDLKKIPFTEIINQTRPFLSDRDIFVRYKAIDLLKKTGELFVGSEEKATVVSLLIEACKDPDSGNSGVASKSLELFSLNDFSQSAMDSLISLLDQHPFFYERIIRMVGFMQSSAASEALIKLKASDSITMNKEKWAIDLALSRTGNQESLEYCFDKILGVSVNNKSVDYLFPDLVYLRQPIALNYMLQEILSDEKKCRSSNPDKEEETICAFKIIELVAPVIENFPVKMTSYGEADIDEYDSTLLRVREWINLNKNYTIIRNIY